MRKELDQFSGDPAGAAPGLIGQLTTTINNLGRTLRDYETYIKNQTLDLNEAQKQKNQGRLENLQKEYDDAKASFTSLRKRREDAQTEAGRSQLFTNKSTAISDNPYDNNTMTSRHTQQPPTETDMSMQEGLYREQNILERSNAQLDDILEMGRQAFDDLVEQNEIVLKMRDRMTSSLATMGVSKATIRTIEKKAFEDKWIFYIGAALTLFLMWLIYHYLG